MHIPLSDLLDRCRGEATEWEPLYDDFVDRLRRSQAGRESLKVGDRLPDFGLPNSRGLLVRSQDLVARGPLVVSFNRGGLCPFCRSELTAWAQHIETLNGLGARFVAITGEVGGRAERLRQEIGLDAEMLCDVDHGVALDLGLAFMLGADLRRRYLDCGLDLTDAYGTASWFLPIPATYLVDREGIIRFAYANPDFRLRAEPEEVLAALRALVPEERS